MLCKLKEAIICLENLCESFKRRHGINSRSLSKGNYILLTIEKRNKITVIPTSQVKLYHKFLHLRIQYLCHYRHISLQH